MKNFPVNQTHTQKINRNVHHEAIKKQSNLKTSASYRVCSNVYNHFDGFYIWLMIIERIFFPNYKFAFCTKHHLLHCPFYNFGCQVIYQAQDAILSTYLSVCLPVSTSLQDRQSIVVLGRSIWWSTWWSIIIVILMKPLQVRVCSNLIHCFHCNFHGIYRLIVGPQLFISRLILVFVAGCRLSYIIVNTCLHVASHTGLS